MAHPVDDDRALVALTTSNTAQRRSFALALERGVLAVEILDEVDDRRLRYQSAAADLHAAELAAGNDALIAAGKTLGGVVTSS